MTIENNTNKLSDIDLTHWRLEFSEDQQCFHTDTQGLEPNTFGWATVVEREEDGKISLFCDIIDEKYKLGETGAKTVKLATIKREWKYFNKTFNKAISLYRRVYRKEPDKYPTIIKKE